MKKDNTVFIKHILDAIDLIRSYLIVCFKMPL